MTDTTDDLRTLAQGAKAWPFKEAAALLKRLGGKTPAKGYALFETGYGPSGLPHIGTFGEVARTTRWSATPLQVLTDGAIPTRLDRVLGRSSTACSKVPDNVPEQASCWRSISASR